MSCRAVGGLSAEMTGAVAATRELSHVLMAVTKAGWLVGLASRACGGLNSAQGVRGACFEFSISCVPLREVICLWESNFLLPGVGEEIPIMFFQSCHVILKQWCEEVLALCIWF